MPMDAERGRRGSRSRCLLVGTGSRAQRYLDAISGPDADVAEVVALADPNPGRVGVHADRLREAGAAEPERLEPAALGDAVRRLGVDRVIVTSPDATHAMHAVTAMDAGADVVVEKPLTTSEEGVRASAAAVERTGRDLTITFDYRYAPRNTALKQVIASGRIGRPTQVHFERVLDTAHGADSFRRWHRDEAVSGGLRFYGAEAAAARGLGPRPERGTTDSPLADAFSLDLRAEPAHRRGAVLLDGAGRVVVNQSTHPELVVDDGARPVAERLVVQRHFAVAEEVPIDRGTGGHGGGDAVLLGDVFRGGRVDPLGHVVSWRDGVRSVVVGPAGNCSLETGQAVRVADLDLGAAASLVAR